MRRFVFAVALLLTVVPASSAAPSKPTSPENCQASTQLQAPGRAARASDLRLTLTYTTEQAPGESPRVMWTLRLRNRTSKTLRLTFPSSQFADVSLRRRGGSVYRWSRGRGFSTDIEHRTMRPHEIYVCTLGPDRIDVDALEPGRYEIFAPLNAYKLQPWSRLRVAARGWFSVH